MKLDWQFMEIPIGKASLEREGSDIAIIAVGHHVQTAITAAEELEKEKGIKAAVINARFVKPIDKEMIIDIALRTRNLITIEENALAGGFGSAVLECLADAGITDINVRRLGLPDRFVEQGAQALLRKEVGLDTESVIQAATDMVNFDQSKHHVAANVHSLHA